MSNKKVLVLGGNFAGLTAALSMKHEPDPRITPPDPSDEHPPTSSDLRHSGSYSVPSASATL
jgi:NADH dehydrogenase FAD-containing subunit